MKIGLIQKDYSSDRLCSGLSDERKFFWGALIGAGVGLASSIIGGAASSKANKKALREAKKQKAENDAWYTRRYNEDYLDTAAGQNLVRKAQEYADRNTKQVSGAAAMGGATDAAVAQAKEQGNKVVADTMANIAAQDVTRKDNADQIKMQNDKEYSQQLQGYYTNQANNISSVAEGLGNAASGLGNALDGYGSAKKSTGV